jgi:hypothetical protein
MTRGRGGDMRREEKEEVSHKYRMTKVTMPDDLAKEV